LVKRFAVIATGAAVSVIVTAGPVLAGTKPDDGEGHGHPLGLGNTLLLFVVVPVAASLLISALAVLPSSLSKPRYRPGKPWDHEPLWIGGPSESQAVAPTDTNARGGASAEW
jgi:hypothetical protein